MLRKVLSRNYFHGKNFIKITRNLKPREVIKLLFYLKVNLHQ